MGKQNHILIFLCCLFILGAASSASGRIHVLSAGEGLVLDESSPGLLRLELETGSVRIESSIHRESPASRIEVDDYPHTYTAEPGRPEIPVKALLLEVPVDTAVELELDSVESHRVPVGHIAPVPYPPTVSVSTWQDPGRTAGANETDPDVYLSGSYYPERIAEVEDLGIMRGRRIVRLRLAPVRYNPAEGRLEIHDRIEVSLRLVKRKSTEFETTRLSTARQGLPFPGYGTLESLKVSVSEDGIYAIDHAALEGQGVDMGSLDPDLLRLYHRGVEVAVYVTAAGGPGGFGPDDKLLFYGEKNTTEFSNTEVYWLVLGDASGLRMEERDGTVTGAGVSQPSFLHTHRAEENIGYQTDIALGDGEDNWFWGSIVSPWEFSFPTSLSGLAPTSDDVDVTVVVYGFSDFFVQPDHHAIVYLNGTEIIDVTFDGRVEQVLEATVSQSVLMEGENSLSIYLPGVPGMPYDSILLNYYDITFHKTYAAESDSLVFRASMPHERNLIMVDGYTEADPHVFDITDPAAPARILNSETLASGGGYLLRFEDDVVLDNTYIALSSARLLSPDQIVPDIPSDLTDTARQADYLIIAYEDFIAPVEALASWREAQGLTVALIDVADVYDEFSYGNLSPDAIRDFLAFAYHEWEAPAPEFALLVGDGSFDYKDYGGYTALGEMNYVPPKLTRAGIVKTVVDNFFACVDGEDHLADIYLGRFPAKTAAQVEAMVDKVIAYETTPDPDLFNTTVMMVAGQEAEFVQASDQLIEEYLCPPHQGQEIYQSVLGSGITQAIIDGIDAGALLVNYRGHGSVSLWADQLGAVIFHESDVDRLDNFELYPIVSSSTCLDGYFANPFLHSLGEELIRTAGKGSVAGFHSSGYASEPLTFTLNQGFFESLFTDNERVLGPVIRSARIHYYESHSASDPVDYSVLLGDPALRIPRGLTDADGDGVPDTEDNCPDVPDPDQGNVDGDCLGDVCDPDIDGDDLPNEEDNCPALFNPGQADGDGDDAGDGCDNCPADYNPGQEDLDDDGTGDLCDDDADGDGYLGSADDCDDADPAVNPGAEEVCSGGIDDDCDGLTDGDDPECVVEFTLSLDASYGSGILILDYTLGLPEPATWINYLVLTAPTIQLIPLWTVPLPAIDPPLFLPISFPFPSLGMVGIWTSLYTAAGPQAFQLAWVNTG